MGERTMTASLHSGAAEDPRQANCCVTRDSEATMRVTWERVCHETTVFFDCFSREHDGRKILACFIIKHVTVTAHLLIPRGEGVLKNLRQDGLEEAAEEEEGKNKERKYLWSVASHLPEAVVSAR